MKEDSSHRPYISFVVVARNDNYGGNFLAHMQVFLKNLLTLCERHALPSELIIVEWNPPQNRERLADVCAWPSEKKFCRVRVIEVPQAVHARFSTRDGLFEYIGKNAGVRRAHGEYVLATNADLLYTEEFIRFLAERRLSPRCFYRIDRYNIEGVEVPADVSVEEQLAFCAQNYSLVQNKYGSDFVRGERKVSLRSLVRAATYLKNVLVHFPHSVPYTNAAGDFFLMARTRWHALKGYPEISPYAFPDALCYMAVALGLRQAVLETPMRIYHQPHERGGADTGRPRSDYESRKKQYRLMLRERKPWIPNGEDWGLGNDTLKEGQIL